MIQYILIFMFLNSSWGDKREKPEPNDIKHTLKLIFSWFSHTCNFDWSVLFANVWTLPHFESIFNCRTL